MGAATPTGNSMKEFFSTEEKPVTSAELIELKKTDPEGFAQIKAGLADGSLSY